MGSDEEERKEEEKERKEDEKEKEAKAEEILRDAEEEEGMNVSQKQDEEVDALAEKLGRTDMVIDVEGNLGYPRDNHEDFETLEFNSKPVISCMSERHSK
ncbi:MAG: hypothetical protein L6R39_003222 [Caloplaca ligustica]|nr:MAG: hypothetical protein L6R39_003222 [Caloplaca ligustica]